LGKLFDALEKAREEDPAGEVRVRQDHPGQDPAGQDRDGSDQDTPGKGSPAKDSGNLFNALEKARQDHTRQYQARQTPPRKDPARQDHDLPPYDTPGPGIPADDRLQMPETLHPSIVTLLKPHSLEAEQFRLLKNKILFPESGDPPRSIMITSPSPCEGKSFVAANLAVTVAKSIDEYVLLMDCDLRSPSLHTLFSFPDVPGLSDHLSRSRPLPDLLKKTFVSKLTLLPAGTIPPNPSELLSSEQMRALLKEVKSRYSDRYVIIDSPPPPHTSETNAIARGVDGIVIVIRYGKTTRKQVENLIDIYGRKKILGVIKNFSKTPVLSRYPYSHYGGIG
jgi:capsular exopolysaccharide synthesis family protein